jgi:hypothetical protein
VKDRGGGEEGRDGGGKEKGGTRAREETHGSDTSREAKKRSPPMSAT